MPSTHPKIDQMHIGAHARIIGLKGGHKAYRQRLIAMGLIPGTEFVISRIAPLGDPIEILVRGTALSLRKSEASILQIEEANV